MDPITFGLVLVLTMNLIAFPFAYKYQTDKLTDITYSMSFAVIVAYGFIGGLGTQSVPKMILAGLIFFWAFRLGAFLLDRVGKMGGDKRFDNIRTNPVRFFRFFVIQAISAWVISLPFLFRLMDHNDGFESISSTSPIEWTGWFLAVLGLGLESISDYQKNTFKFQKGNEDKLFTGGLFQTIQYPNYLGEMSFWIGIFLASTPALYGARWATIASPIIIILLLLFLSGIPTVEKARKKRHGNDPMYVEYASKTAKLIPGIY